MTDHSKVNLSEQAVIVRKAIPFMAAHGIDMTPDNYRIWYDYFMGQKPEIKEHLDYLIRNKVEFTSGAMEKIYREFYVRDFAEETNRKLKEEMEAAQYVSRKAGELLARTLKHIVDSAESTTGYGEKLQHYINAVEHAEKLEDIESIIGSLVQDTTEAVKKSSLTQEMLSKSTEELSSISDELEKARLQAYTDDLTRIYNRRYFDEKGKRLLAKLEQEGKCASMIMLDIDHFKNFNDKYGHQVGDKLLKVFSAELKRVAAKAGIVCRYGGEEFAVLVPDLRLTDAAKLAERLRHNIQEMEFTVRGKPVSVTFSGGVSMFNRGESLGAVIKRADKALYLSKNSGRNQVRTELEL